MTIDQELCWLLEQVFKKTKKVFELNKSFTIIEIIMEFIIFFAYIKWISKICDFKQNQAKFYQSQSAN